MTWKRWSLAAAGVSAMLVLGLSLVQGQDSYKARLSPLPADAKTRQELTGGGTITATLQGTKLNINGSFSGLKTPAVMAKLQNGVAAGVRGPEIQDLTVTKATDGTISGSANLNADQIAHLKKGGLYIELYTQKPADGTLWGWFLK